jgi:hypothetical protein
VIKAFFVIINLRKRKNLHLTKTKTFSSGQEINKKLYHTEKRQTRLRDNLAGYPLKKQKKADDSTSSALNKYLAYKLHAAYFPAQPLPPFSVFSAFSSGSFSMFGSLLTASVFSSSASKVLTALSLSPSPPLPDAACSTFSVLPAPGTAVQPLAACTPGAANPPALIKPAIPRLARIFFISLLFIPSSSKYLMNTKLERNILSIE